MEYIAPTVADLGSFAELTQSTINKTAGTGDVIVIAGIGSIDVPGSDITSIS